MKLADLTPRVVRLLEIERPEPVRTSASRRVPSGLSRADYLREWRKRNADWMRQHQRNYMERKSANANPTHGPEQVSSERET